jgi:hypothetical protein
MRITLTLSGSLECGEGYLTPRNLEKVKRLIFENPLLAADVLSDWKYELEQLYIEAVLEMGRDFKRIRQKQ